MRTASLIAASGTFLAMLIGADVGAAPVIISIDGKAPLRVEARELSVEEKDGVALFWDAELWQGNLHMRCQKLVVRFKHDVVKELKCEVSDQDQDGSRYQ